MVLYSAGPSPKPDERIQMRHTSKQLQLTCILIAVWGAPNAANADELEARLAKLKVICDKGLVPEDECKARRKKLLDLLTSGNADEVTWSCSYGGELTSIQPVDSKDGTTFSESASASVAVREILDTAGLVGNFVVRPANVPNAMASIRGSNRYIEYSPRFVNQLKLGTKTNWSVYSVLAHEIGHHLQGHTITPGGSRPDIELEADEYSGFILAQMGATKADAQKAMRLIGSDTTSGTHPAKGLRLAAIEKGWRNGVKKRKKQTADHEKDPTAEKTPTVETPLPDKLPPPLQQQPILLFRCVVNGEQVVIDQSNRVLSVPQNGRQVGQRVPSTHPNCAFNLAAPPTGVYCVGHNGYVFFGTPVPVGQCTQCGPSGC